MTERVSGFEQVGEYLWEMKPQGGMRVPARIYADRRLMLEVSQDKSPQQVANVAHLPGIVKHALAMPDIHWGYGFPIGGVAATDPAAGGVISPGGIGYDINCGVRLVRSNLDIGEVQNRIKDMAASLFRDVPAGLGSKGELTSDLLTNQQVLVEGSRWALRKGYGVEQDLDRTEEGGRLAGADPAKVSRRALERGNRQLGTLGSGNHFLEIDVVDEVYLPETAAAFGLRKGQVVFLIHSGSRGLGHQVCDDYLRVMGQVVRDLQIQLPDRQLACAPLESPAGRDYFAAMACAANFAWANRQAMTHLARHSVSHALKTPVEELGMDLVYDVAHNIAKFEMHSVDGQMKRLCVHRKGATRAFPAGHPDVPAGYREHGQPVLVPGDMGTASHVMVGCPGAMSESFGSTCHGAGRVLGRREAKRQAHGRNIRRELEERGIVVFSEEHAVLAEEMPEAYKDVDHVVEIVHNSGLASRVVRMKPLGVVKG